MILTSMEEDPEDVKPGNAFLSRYMPALESVVEQIEKLTALETLSSSSSQAMDKCLHALQGLRSAFAQQYEQLQENNQLKFNVEMEMLDSLLKTDGFK
jgi:5-bromo-4-chloroindolyl phosphate hydrolysis protein